jgi:hypothetical protein
MAFGYPSDLPPWRRISVTGCSNATEFQARLVKLRAIANEQRVSLRERVLLDSSTKDDAEASAMESRRKHWLECHVRDHVINHLLAALNWQSAASYEGGEYYPPNLATEQPTSPTSLRQGGGESDSPPERTRRFDYLGYERLVDRPLMLVEAKRPEVSILGGTQPVALPEAHPTSTAIVSYLAESWGAGGKVSDKVPVAWQDLIVQVRDYAQAVKRNHAVWPMRVVLTNGEWLVVLTNPEAVLSENGPAAFANRTIIVLDCLEQIVNRSDLLWQYLEYRRLAGDSDESCTPSELQFLVDPAAVSSCMFGLQVIYSIKPGIYTRPPFLTVSPIVLLKSLASTFVQVGLPFDQEIPDDRDLARVRRHVDEVHTQALAVKMEIERVLRLGTLAVTSLEDHVADAAALLACPVLRTVPTSRGNGTESRCVVITGAHTHLLKPISEYSTCRFHNHSHAASAGAALAQGPITQPSVDFRSYFTDASPMHCAHRAVQAVKQAQITENNRSRCGHRGTAIDGSAFCELWGFERMLCCRSCALSPACLRAPAFNLPCASGMPSAVVSKTVSQHLY